MSDLIQYYGLHEVPCTALFVTLNSLLIVNSKSFNAPSLKCAKIFTSFMKVITVLTVGHTASVISVMSEISYVYVISNMSYINFMNVIIAISPNSVSGVMSVNML